MKQLKLPVYNLETLPISQYYHCQGRRVPAQSPGARTSVSGRSCVCTGLSRRHPSHRARSPRPPHLPHHQFHFYWLQPQNTAAPLDTKEPKRQALFATVNTQPNCNCSTGIPPVGSAVPVKNLSKAMENSALWHLSQVFTFSFFLLLLFCFQC